MRHDSSAKKTVGRFRTAWRAAARHGRGLEHSTQAPEVYGSAWLNLETADLLRKHDPESLRQALHRMLLRQGLASFVQDTITPLNHAVGESWSRGELEVYEEHLYTEAVQWVLRNALAGLTDRHGRPRALLTTLPEEPHGLGILMVAAMLALEGAYCLSLGPQTPLEEIANAARAQAVDVVVLSFSIIYPPRRIPPALEELRQRLDPAIEIWAGGAARLHRAAAGTRLLPTMEDALAALADWRAAHAGLSHDAVLGAES